MSKVKPKEFWTRHIAAFQESRTSQREYCRAHGLSHRTFNYHLRKNRLIGPGNSTRMERASGWLPMTIVDEPTKLSPGRIRLQISRVTIEAEPGFDDTHLANVLRAVGAVC
jgi:hypothetical protein